MGTEPSLQVAENEASDSCPDDELLLVERLKKRDAGAFQELIDLHGETLRTLIGRLMAFDPEMEDVLQNTFVQVWRKIPSFRSQSSIRTWITRIAINQTRNHQRSVRRWLRHFQDRFTLETTEKEHPCMVESTQDPRWDSILLAMKKLPYRMMRWAIGLSVTRSSIKIKAEARFHLSVLRTHGFQLGPFCWCQRRRVVFAFDDALFKRVFARCRQRVAG